MLLTSKTVRLKMKTAGDAPVAPQVLLYYVDFHNHYTISVDESAWSKAIVGKDYTLDIKETQGGEPK